MVTIWGIAIVGINEFNFSILICGNDCHKSGDAGRDATCHLPPSREKNPDSKRLG